MKQENGKFIEWIMGHNSQDICESKNDTTLNTDQYLVELPEGTQWKLLANKIDKCMFSQVDHEFHLH